MHEINDRGMIKWQPFDSVTSTKKITNDLDKDKQKVSMPILSQDQIDYIEEIIKESYYNGEEIILSIYRNGYITNKKAIIRYIDTLKKQLILSDKSIIYFKQIIKIKQI